MKLDFGEWDFSVNTDNFKPKEAMLGSALPMIDSYLPQQSPPPLVGREMSESPEGGIIPLVVSHLRAEEGQHYSGCVLEAEEPLWRCLPEDGGELSHPEYWLEDDD